MKKVLSLVLALMLCLSATAVFAESTAPVKVGVLVPVMTHGWVSGITYQAEAYAKELTAEGIRNIGPTVELMAANEQLDAHKNAMTLRLKTSPAPSQRGE